MFDHFDACAFLLYKLNRVSPVIFIPNAKLLSLIQVFDNAIECHHRIDANILKPVTLFGYDENMQRWLSTVNLIPNNLRSVNIFYHVDDEPFVAARVINYRERFGNTSFDKINAHELDQELLSFSLKYLKLLRKQFREDLGILNLLNEDYRAICRALADDALMNATNENERMRESEEAQD